MVDKRGWLDDITWKGDKHSEIRTNISNSTNRVRRATIKFKYGLNTTYEVVITQQPMEEEE